MILLNVTVFGVGYVGLVQGAVLAEIGHDVVCVDVDENKIKGLRKGVIPIYEIGLKPMVDKNLNARRLNFTTDARKGVAHGEILFIAVGTPPDEDGSADLKYVEAVAKTIAKYMDEYRIVVTKSTVPVGTSDRVRNVISETQKKENKTALFDVVSNPEFLREGSAVADCLNPERIVIGVDNFATEKKMKDLYSYFCTDKGCIITMDVRSAELTKYAANSMLATKISFMNEIASLCEHLGADVEKVREGIGGDTRIGSQFLNPGCGYGGSCFPKDVQALIRTATNNGYKPKILQAVEDVNNKQKEKLFDLVNEYFSGNLKGKTFALWGLSFKPNTDDLREAPSRTLMEALWRAGASVRAFDPVGMDEARRIYGNEQHLALVENKRDALKGADALIICTEWNHFKQPSFEFMKENLKEPVIFDGRNIYDVDHLTALNFKYYSIGRGLSSRKGIK